MSNPKRFTSPIMTAVFFAACLTCGNAAAQDAAVSKASQDAPQVTREAGTEMSTGKRQHQPLVITKDVDKHPILRTMAGMDTDKDGRLSRTEFAAAHGGKTDEFAAHDGNGDGFISKDEMAAHHAAMNPEHEAAPTVHEKPDKPHH